MGGTDLSVLPQRHVVLPESVFRSAAAGDVPLRVQGIVSQSGNLQEWQDSTGTAQMYVKGNSLLMSGSLQVGNRVEEGAQQMLLQNNFGSQDALVIRGAASQAGYLTTWQNSAQGIVSYIDSAGSFNTAGGRTTITAASGRIGSIQENHTLGTHSFFGGDPVLGLQVTAAARKGLIVRGAASQTGNLQEWQNSSGVIRASVASDGTYVSQASVQIGNPGYLGSALNVRSTGTGERGIVVRGIAGQTANLLEWQDSAGNVLGRVDPGGTPFWGSNGLRTTHLSSTDDLNTQRPSGIYDSNLSPNRPTASDWHHIIQATHVNANGYMFQIAVPFGGTTMYVRSAHANVWTAWRAI